MKVNPSVSKEQQRLMCWELHRAKHSRNKRGPITHMTIKQLTEFCKHLDRRRKKRHRTNPGAAWHRRRADAAAASRKMAKTEEMRAYYLGMEDTERAAYRESEKLHLNPGHRIVYHTIAMGQDQRGRDYLYLIAGDKIPFTVKNRRMGMLEKSIKDQSVARQRLKVWARKLRVPIQ